MKSGIVGVASLATARGWDLPFHELPSSRRIRTEFCPIAGKRHMFLPLPKSSANHFQDTRLSRFRNGVEHASARRFLMPDGINSAVTIKPIEPV